MPASTDASATPPPLRTHRAKGIALRYAAITAFSAMAAAIKIGDERGVHVVEMMFFRAAFGLLPLLGWILWLREWDVWRTQRPRAHLLRSTLGLSSMALAFSALALLPLAEATTISFAAPLFALALSAPLLGEHVDRARWAAVAVGFAGVIVVVRPGGSGLPLLGTMVALGAALGVAGVTVALRSISRTEGTRTIVFWFTLLSAAVTGALLPWFGQWHDGATWLLLAGLGLVGGVGQLFLTASLRWAPISALAPIDYLQLVYSVAVGWLIWGTQPAWSTWVGAALIIAGVLASLRRERPALVDPEL